MKLFSEFLVITVLLRGTLTNVRDDIRNCNVNPPFYPSSTVNTTERIAKLREEMRRQNISAYIIPSTDAHGNEYVRIQDKRRGYISGFTATAGTAIVTMDKNAVWADGRYFTEAERELDCNWILQKRGMKGVPGQTEWLKEVLKPGDVVGIHPFLISIVSWNSRMLDLQKANITLKGVLPNLVDQIWDGRPIAPLKKVNVQPIQYTGKSWNDKVKDVQQKMEEVKATAHVVQALDAVAWLLNLRGEEIPYNPVFYAYVIVKQKEVLFFVDADKISSLEVQKHLKISSCNKNTESYCITRKDYHDIKSELEKFSNEANAKIWVSPFDSYALKMSVGDDTIYLRNSPITLMKAKKNEVEMKGMINSHLKDSVALTDFFMWAEEQVAAKAENLTELRLADKMEEFRSQQDLYKGLSFASIIGFGDNSAVIHYIPSKETNRNITDKGTLLADTGSQYSDGTTDVTRTVHFGTPTEKQKNAFTRVLMGHINLAVPVFPQGTYGRELDIYAREALYRNGWDYRHGTGHGIGSYLYIHEGPGAFGKVGSSFPLPNEAPLELGFVITDEPGFYEPGNFGIRIETTLMVINASTPNRFNDVDYYTFEPICYFPIQRKLIDVSLMTKEQLWRHTYLRRVQTPESHISKIKWLDDYHKKTRKIVGDELKRQGKTKGYEWMVRQTEPIGTGDKTGAAVTLAWFTPSLIISIIVTLF